MFNEYMKNFHYKCKKLEQSIDELYIKLVVHTELEPIKKEIEELKKNQESCINFGVKVHQEVENSDSYIEDAIRDMAIIIRHSEILKFIIRNRDCRFESVCINMDKENLYISLNNSKQFICNNPYIYDIFRKNLYDPYIVTFGDIIDKYAEVDSINKHSNKLNNNETKLTKLEEKYKKELIEKRYLEKIMMQNENINRS